MKNVKILLLLGVMLVNVMPYLKDGKIEWKAAQAEAQYFTIEFYPVENGIEYLCGDYSFQWNIFPWFEPCENLNPPPSDPNDGGPCSPESIISWSIGHPRDYIGLNKQNWCVFLVLNAIDGKEPCVYATKYYYNTWQYSFYEDFCNIDNPVATDCISSLAAFYGISISEEVSLTATGNEEKCKQLLKLMVNWGGNCNGDDKGILFQTTNHISLAYEFRKEEYATFAQTWVTYYNTDDNNGNTWSHKIQLGDFINRFNSFKFVKK